MTATVAAATAVVATAGKQKRARSLAPPPAEGLFVSRSISGCNPNNSSPGQHPTGLADCVLVRVDTDENSIRNRSFQYFVGVPSPAQGSVEIYMTRPAVEGINSLFQHNRRMI